ncbi:hypothetical protein [Chondromyces apiculatus]|uniref:Lipoprotein n=1 Tax=Chondromyces apiculatus DSM 436 TaxID=1192034 RepID=A0A017TBR3_9BACT|nr:hypothetical protein [Chondromyces apiculatus]EYF06362.1 Hypothetical protein CAP_1892 [Chondromyces apiculatus DSM 436]
MKRYLALGVLAASALLVACEQGGEAIRGMETEEATDDRGGEEESAVAQGNDGSLLERVDHQMPPEASLDLEGFEPVPAFEDLDLGRLQPLLSFTYAEMRQVLGSGEPQVQSSAGTKCGEARDRAACIDRFDALSAARANESFNRGCLPLGCYSYLAINSGEINFTLNSGDQLLRYVDDVKTREVALLLVSSAGYRWDGDSDVSRGGIREVDGGYEVVALRYTRTCAPIVEERVVLLVESSGQLTRLASETASSLPGACF